MKKDIADLHLIFWKHQEDFRGIL